MKKTISLQLLWDGILRILAASWFCTNAILLFINKKAFTALDYVREVSMIYYFFFWAIVFVMISYLYIHSKNPIRKSHIAGYGLLLYTLAIILKEVVIA